MKNIELKTFKEMLYNESKKYGFCLSDNALDKLEIYKDMLLEWNEKINLTSITDEYQIIVKHFIDCLECTKYISEKDKVIDIGTGAGFPGMVLSIYFEDRLNITLLDSLNKRLIFLDEVKNRLNLKNITIVHGRAEDMANDLNYREKYDVAFARAVASLNVLAEYTSPYIKVNGRCIYMKGDNVKEEIDYSKRAFQILNLKIKSKKEYELDIEENSSIETFRRYIVEVEKSKNTPKNYPRSYGKIKKLPL